MSRDGFVVTRPYPTSGVGSNLTSLAGAVWLAQQLGRSVIVDWRGSTFLKEPSRNYFSEFLETPPEIQGVPVLYAGADAVPEDDESSRFVAEPSDIGDVLGGRIDLPPFLVLTTFHGYERVDHRSSDVERHWRLKDFYRWIRPNAFVAEAIDAFWAEHLHERFVVGVNITTGNGEYEKGNYYFGRVDLTLFENEDWFLRRIRFAFDRAIRRLPRHLRADARIFFATDGYAMHDLLERLPSAVTRRRFFPPRGIGRQYGDYAEQGYSDTEAARDTVADMFMLGRCNAFVRNTGTVFNTYALVTTDFFNGNFQDLDRLYAHYWWRAARNRARRLARR